MTPSDDAVLRELREEIQYLGTTHATPNFRAGSMHKALRLLANIAAHQTSERQAEPVAHREMPPLSEELLVMADMHSINSYGRDVLRRAATALAAPPVQAPEPWLEDLIEMAQEYADQFSAAYAGYKPERHAHHAAVLKQARAAAPPVQAPADALDARRYRWLRQWPSHFAMEAWGRYGAGLPIHKMYVNTSERLDAAIDAAMLAASPTLPEAP